ncbi:squalene/phytoene synthase family protein [Falsiroseomonas sp. HW251]|uniref:squalene/phytoene synthase family protein n=1 Tax=Falsiroseomonas sp. HW251 TaxID=3390998 RepID=UPI003D313FCF
MAETPALAGFVRAHDPDRFLCLLFAPAAGRDALLALTAFNHELARAREAATLPIAALIRLQWWREAVEEAAAGKPARRHEVAGPLHAAVAAGALDPALLLAMVEAREIEAEEGAIATEQDFVTWLRGTAGGWSAAAGAALGATEAQREILRALGAAYGLAGVLRAMPAQARRGRCLLPRDRLARQGLTAEQAVAAPEAPPLRALVAEMAAEGAVALAGADRGLPTALVAAALPAVLARRDLARLAAGGMPEGRGIADRLAVTLAGLLGRA